MALSEDDVQKIVEAMIPVMDARIQESLQAQDPVNGETEPVVDDIAPPMDDMGGEPPMPEGEMPMEGEMPADEARPSIEGDDSEDQPIQMESDEDPAQYQAEDDDNEPSDPDDEPAKPAVAKYAKMRDERDAYAQKYRKEVTARRELQQKYEKLVGQVEQHRRAAQYANRRQALAELNTQGYVFELEDEFEDTKDMPEEQFTRHCNRIATKYQKVPVGGGALPMTKPRVSSTGEQPTPEQVSRYSKKAREVVEQYRKQYPNADTGKVFKEAYEQALREDQASGSAPPAPGV